MADLYGTDCHRSAAFESEEMSLFLQNILQNSSSTPPYASFKAKHCSDFSGPGGFFPTEAKEGTINPFSPSGANSDPNTSSRRILHDVVDFDFGSEEPEESELPANPALPRSSKRTRAAEIHNLSEKRRRSRINEKLKALQTLIPNSNKTDKASMLDEAIEYLKQLQLQVQTLTMRNGLCLSPAYLPETPQLVQLTYRGLDYDEGNGLINANRGDTVSRLCQAPQSLSVVIPSTENINSSGTSFGLEPSIPQVLNHPTSSKDICRVDSASELLFDINCSGKKSFSGVS